VLTPADLLRACFFGCSLFQLLLLFGPVIVSLVSAPLARLVQRSTISPLASSVPRLAFLSSTPVAPVVGCQATHRRQASNFALTFPYAPVALARIQKMRVWASVNG